MRQTMEAEPLVRPDYAAVVDPARLEEPERLDPASTYRLLVAAAVGPVRLIDNLEAPATIAQAPAQATKGTGWSCSVA